MSNHHEVLACQKLGKTFYDGTLHVDVLHGIHLSIKTGETVAIVGSSGSGKSTLLHLLGGLDHASVGDVWVAGQKLSDLSEKKLGLWRNQQLGFVYQFHHLLPEFTALENIAMPLFIRQMKPKEALERAHILLDKVGLCARAKHKPSELSGGERQRVALARALVTEPKCVLADEPTGNLDRRTSAQVYELLHHLNQTLQTSFLIATHDMELAGQMQRCLHLVDGRLG